jgi:hypothetical protein
MSLYGAGGYLEKSGETRKRPMQSQDFPAAGLKTVAKTKEGQTSLQADELTN